ncbi:hypothetical protein KM043_001849 [Ampulex compressa]|nr:hypothetical protein KM043_001849 [Ampulex compressa]
MDGFQGRFERRGPIFEGHLYDFVGRGEPTKRETVSRQGKSWNASRSVDGDTALVNVAERRYLVDRCIFLTDARVNKRVGFCDPKKAFSGNPTGRKRRKEESARKGERRIKRAATLRFDRSSERRWFEGRRIEKKSRTRKRLKERDKIERSLVLGDGNAKTSWVMTGPLGRWTLKRAGIS